MDLLTDTLVLEEDSGDDDYDDDGDVDADDREASSHIALGQRKVVKAKRGAAATRTGICQCLAVKVRPVSISSVL